MLLAIGGAPASAVPPIVTTTDIGTLGGPFGIPTAVNAHGQVVGRTTTASNQSRAFSWTKEGGIVDLGAGTATALNDSGQVVGSGTGGAFSWTPGGGKVVIGTLGGLSATARAVSSTGQVVGSSFLMNGSAQEHAFSWTEAGGLIDLGTLGGTSSWASAVNANGLVVGLSDTASGQTHAFAWTQMAGMVDLGTLGGTRSEAVAVNASGQIVGNSWLSGDLHLHAFSWTQSGGMVDLGTLGGSSSSAVGIDDSGTVVGNSSLANVFTRAYRWTQSGGMVELGTLGGAVSSAAAINAAGQVVGTSNTFHGFSRAFSWRPADGMVELANLGGLSGQGIAVGANGHLTGLGTTFDNLQHPVLWELGPPDTAPPPPPAPDPPGRFLRVKGYGSAEEEILTPADVELFGTVGSYNSQPSLFISTFDLETHERWQIQLVPAAGSPLQPGTYTNAGGPEAFPHRPVVHVIHVGGTRGNFSCGGGSFTIKSLDLGTSSFDVEWAQSGGLCASGHDSGHAVFPRPADTTPPSAPTATADREPDYPGNGAWFKDAVTVSFAENGDPRGPDFFPGTGVDPASIPAPVTFTSNGSHTASGALKDLAGNESAPGTLTVRVDADAPVLSATFGNADGSVYVPGTWTNQPVTVTFTCSDAGGSGVNESPLTFTAPAGRTPVNGTCTDNVGHATTKSFGEILVDVAAPEAVVRFDPVSRSLVVLGSDTSSGAPTGPVTPTAVPAGAATSVQSYLVTDAAGNTLTIVLELKTGKTAVVATIVSLRYNRGPVLRAPENDLSFGWQLKADGSLKSLSQVVRRIRTAGKTTARAEYDAARNVTELTRTNPAGRSSHAGLRLLTVRTSSSALELEAV